MRSKDNQERQAICRTPMAEEGEQQLMPFHAGMQMTELANGACRQLSVNYFYVQEQNVVQEQNTTTNIEGSNIERLGHGQDNPGLNRETATPQNAEDNGYNPDMVLGENPADVTWLSSKVVMFHKRPINARQISNSKVYHGRQEIGNGFFRDVAIKLMQYSERDWKEVQTLLKLSHPNIVQIYDVGENHALGHWIYIVMELCSKNLQEYINEIPVSSEKAMSFSKQMVSAVDFMHKRNIAHRDIKPSNILISKCGGFIKITDFGISKEIPFGQTSVTDTSQAAGSEGYKPPELYDPDYKVSLNSDIFSLGLVMAYLLSRGKHPFGDKPFDWGYKIRNNIGFDLSSIPLCLPKRRELVYLVKQMLEHDRTKRPTIQQVEEIISSENRTENTNGISDSDSSVEDETAKYDRAQIVEINESVQAASTDEPEMSQRLPDINVSVKNEDITKISLNQETQQTAVPSLETAEVEDKYHDQEADKMTLDDGAGLQTPNATEKSPSEVCEALKLSPENCFEIAIQASQGNDIDRLSKVNAYVKTNIPKICASENFKTLDMITFKKYLDTSGLDNSENLKLVEAKLRSDSDVGGEPRYQTTDVEIVKLAARLSTHYRVKYQALTAHCHSVLKRELSDSNCINMAMFADQCRLGELKVWAQYHVIMNFPSILSKISEGAYSNEDLTKFHGVTSISKEFRDNMGRIRNLSKTELNDSNQDAVQKEIHCIISSYNKMMLTKTAFEWTFKQLNKLGSTKTEIIGKSGGLIELDGCSLTFPEDALQTDTELTVTINTDRDNCSAAGTAITPILRVEPSINFQKPVKVKLQTCFAAELGQRLPTQLAVNHGSGWQQVCDAAIGSQFEIHFEVLHFSDVVVTATSTDDGTLRVRNDVFIHSDSGLVASCFYLFDRDRTDLKKTMREISCGRFTAHSLDVKGKQSDLLKLELVLSTPVMTLSQEDWSGDDIFMRDIYEKRKMQFLVDPGSTVTSLQSGSYISGIYKVCVGSETKPDAVTRVKQTWPVRVDLETSDSTLISMLPVHDNKSHTESTQSAHQEVMREHRPATDGEDRTLSLENCFEMTIEASQRSDADRWTEANTYVERNLAAICSGEYVKTVEEKTFKMYMQHCGLNDDERLRLDDARKRYRRLEKPQYDETTLGKQTEHKVRLLNDIFIHIHTGLITSCFYVFDKDWEAVRKEMRENSYACFSAISQSVEGNRDDALKLQLDLRRPKMTLSSEYWAPTDISMQEIYEKGKMYFTADPGSQVTSLQDGFISGIYEVFGRSSQKAETVVRQRWPVPPDDLKRTENRTKDTHGIPDSNPSAESMSAKYDLARIEENYESVQSASIDKSKMSERLPDINVSVKKKDISKISLNQEVDASNKKTMNDGAGLRAPNAPVRSPAEDLKLSPTKCFQMAIQASQRNDTNQLSKANTYIKRNMTTICASEDFKALDMVTFKEYLDTSGLTDLEKLGLVLKKLPHQKADVEIVKLTSRLSTHYRAKYPAATAHCHSVLKRELTDSNCINMTVFADQCRLSELKVWAQYHVIMNFPSILSKISEGAYSKEDLAKFRDMSSIPNEFRDNMDRVQSLVDTDLKSCNQEEIQEEVRGIISSYDTMVLAQTALEWTLVQLRKFSSSKTKTIGKGGGIMELDGCSLIFPKDALQSDTKITMTVNTDRDNCPTTGKAITPILRVEPSMTFNKPVKVIMQTCFAAELGQRVPAQLTVNHGSGWQQLCDVMIGSKFQICFDAYHFNDMVVTVPQISGGRLHIQNDIFFHIHIGKIVSCFYLFDRDREDLMKTMMRISCATFCPHSLDFEGKPSELLKLELALTTPATTLSHGYWNADDISIQDIYEKGSMNLAADPGSSVASLLRGYYISGIYKVSVGSATKPVAITRVKQPKIKSHNHLAFTTLTEYSSNQQNVSSQAAQRGVSKMTAPSTSSLQVTGSEDPELSLENCFEITIEARQCKDASRWTDANTYVKRNLATICASEYFKTVNDNTRTAYLENCGLENAEKLQLQNLSSKPVDIFLPVLGFARNRLKKLSTPTTEQEIRLRNDIFINKDTGLITSCFYVFHEDGIDLRKKMSQHSFANFSWCDVTLDIKGDQDEKLKLDLVLWRPKLTLSYKDWIPSDISMREVCEKGKMTFTADPGLPVTSLPKTSSVHGKYVVLVGSASEPAAETTVYRRPLESGPIMDKTEWLLSHRESEARSRGIYHEMDFF